ncbi:MAG: copper resistance protein B [Sulfuriferula sp.]
MHTGETISGLRLKQRIRSVAIVWLWMVFGMPVAGYADPSQIDPTMNMQPNQPNADGSNAMAGMNMSGAPPMADRSAPPVGSLPRSDGSAGKPDSAYGIGNGMTMDDDSLISKFMLDQLELVQGNNGDQMAWDGHYRIGYDMNQLWIRSEGQQAHGKTQDADAELLWGHTISPYWDTMLGTRHDFGGGPARDWAAEGIQGIAPYKFDVEATAYEGSAGRTAARVKVYYDILFTQRLILIPEIEINAYGKDDPTRAIGAGLSDTSLSLRLNYYIRREFAPYIGIGTDRKFGKTADFAQAVGLSATDNQLMAGINFWF